MTVGNLGQVIGRHADEVHALRERVDYLVVAVGRGDPRFTRPAFANPGFDGVAFDDDWRARGRRVPPLTEIFGAAQ